MAQSMSSSYKNSISAADSKLPIIFGGWEGAKNIEILLNGWALSSCWMVFGEYVRR